MSEIAIRVSNLVKDYEVYHRPIDAAVEVLTRRHRHKIFRALDRVTFEVPRGEVLGIIGPNGAGKSTLLKIITGVLDATSGEVEVNGKVTAILELGLGFNPEYSGRENIYLSGLLYGMERGEIDRKVDLIIEFSGLQKFIERPVKTYSSGMQARLAFSIATSTESNLLIIDEALAAGDAAFLQKCMRRIRYLCSGGRTVLMVSHGTSLLAQLCSRVMWMEEGVIKMIGPALSVVRSYDLASHQNSDSNSWIETVEDRLVKLAQIEKKQVAGQRMDTDQMVTAFTSTGPSDPFEETGRGHKVFRRGPIFIDNIELLNHKREETTRLAFMEPFYLRIHYHCEGPLPEDTLGIAIAINQAGNLAPVMQWFTQDIMPGEAREEYSRAAFRVKPSERGTIELRFPFAQFRGGEYFLSIGLLPNQPGTWEFYEYRHFFYTFVVEATAFEMGAPIFLPPKFTHIDGTCAEPGDAGNSIAPPLQEAAFATLGEEVAQICFREGRYPDGWPSHESCPACGGGPLLRAFSKDGFSHKRCALCNFVCVDPYPPDHILRRLYSGNYYTLLREHYELPRLKEGGGSQFSAPKEILEEVIDYAAGGRQVGTWLEVGGGIGAFASLIGERRPGWSVVLNDDNPRSLDIAKRHFGIETVCTDSDALYKSGNRYDVISSVAVLEHMPNPADFLYAYGRLLKPGGVMITVIPQFTHLNCFVSKAASPNAAPPFHLSLFNADNLRRMFLRTGLFSEMTIDERGPSAFYLHHHLDVNERYDVTMPTVEIPQPQPVLRKPFSVREAEVHNALSGLDSKVADFFAEADGRLYLIVYARTVSNQ